MMTAAFDPQRDGTERYLTESPKGMLVCCHKHTPRTMRIILCPTCGNKRCPKASDCGLECSGSNEPGQKGSIYE